MLSTIYWGNIMSLQLSAPSVALFLYLAWASAAPPTPTPAPPVQFLAPTGGGWKDPAIIAAIIVVITTIITSITSQVYHIRHTRKIEGEKVRLRRLHSRET